MARWPASSAGWRDLWTLGTDVRAGRWDPTVAAPFDAQRLGIIGLGRIGSALASRARALGIEVVGTDPSRRPRGR